MRLAVRLGGETFPAGIAHDNAEKLAAMEQSLRTLAALATEGIYAMRHQAPWTFSMEYASTEDWREFLDKPTRGDIEADDGLLESALARPEGKIVLSEDDVAQVYEALPVGV